MKRIFFTRYILCSFFLVIGWQAAKAQATITPDLPDYAPLSTATFTGTGFMPDEMVVLKVKNLFQPCHTANPDSSYLPWTVTADANGAFVTTWTVCDCAGDSLRVKATGQTSGLIALAYFSDASVTAATGGTNISADKAANAISPAYTALGNIVITEAGANGDFSTSATSITLNAPGNWEFNPTGVTTTVDLGSGGQNVLVTGVSYSGTTGITIGLSVNNGTLRRDRLTISGLQVRSTNGASLPATGNITPTLVGTITGVTNGMNMGSLSQVAGAAASISVATASTQIEGTAFPLSMTAKDQFGTTATSFTGVNAKVNFSVNAGAITPLVSGSFTNGLRTENVTLAQPGTGRTITAVSSGSLSTGATGTSGGFTVNSNTASYFRSKAGGDWNTVTNWESSFNNTNWGDATLAPTALANTVTIRNGHVINISATMSLDQVVVDAGAQISINPATLVTLLNGTGIDLTIDGDVLLNGTINQDGLSSIEVNGDLHVSSSGLINGGGGNGATRPSIDINNGGTWLIDAGGSFAPTGVPTVVTINTGGTGTFNGLITGPDIFTINGTATSSGNFIMSTISSLQIGGRLEMTSGTLSLIRGNGGTLGSVTSGGELLLSGNSIFALNGSGIASYSIDLNGSLVMGQNAIVNGVGQLFVSGGANLTIGSADGIVDGTTTIGNVRTSSADSYSATANYTYKGTGSQNTGAALPATVNNLIIDNASGAVTPTNNITTSGTLTIMPAATFKKIGTYTLTLGAGGLVNNGTIELNGNTASCPETDLVLVRSSVAGTQRPWSGSGTFNLTDVNVQDQGIAGGASITVLSSTNAGNNGSNWNFIAGCTACSVPGQPDNFTVSTAVVCQGEQGVTYTIPDDPTVSYSWSYTGTGQTINGTGNSVTVDFNSTATSGNLSVTPSRICGPGPARSISITVNQKSMAASSATANPTSICPGQSSVLTYHDGSAGTNAVFNWYKDAACTQLAGTGQNLNVSPAGTTTYWGRYEDPAPCSFNTNTVFVKVTVDETPPATPTIADATGECSATATAPTTTDNCAGTVTGTTSDPLTYSTQGTHVITWTFNDGNGNSTTATQNVVVDDVTAPATPTIADATGECSATATAPTTTDNCAGTVTGTTSDPLTYSTQGTHVITWTFNDGNGNSTTATQNVVVDDVTAPATPTIADATGECLATATAPTTSDNCAGTVTGTTSDPLTYSTQGTHVITWTFNDGNGNSTTATQNVVVDDVTAPATPTIADATGECSATATAPTTTDNCAGTITGTTSDPLTYSTQGTHVITWTFNDGNGNSTTATQNVVVDDVTAPVTPTITDATGECSATATAPTTTDNCAGTITGTTSDPLTYSTQGTHVITWIFNDGNGNSTTATQNVVVDDITPPSTPTIPNATGECSATATAPTTTDNCAGTVTGTTSDPLTYSTQGTHVITWTFNDGNGNSTTATQNVVVDDVTAPATPTITDATGECSATATAPTTTDNCAGTVTGTTSDPLTYSTQGTHVITWTFNDGHGNSTTATQNVVVDDVTAPATPTITDATGECSATATAPTTTDNCAGTVTGTTSDPLTYSTQGTHVITWTFNDGNGNNTTATQNVVVDDITPPSTPTIPNATGECSAIATAPTTTDNCAGTVTGTTSDPLTYSTQGTHVITWTFNDGNGNSTTASQNVVVDDITPPSTPTIPNATGECSATATAPTTTDNCAGTVTGTTSDPLTYSTQGTHVITWTFNDGNGNSTTATQNVVVSSGSSISINCTSNKTGISANNASCTYKLAGNSWDATVSGACTVTTVKYTLSGATSSALNAYGTLANVVFNTGTTTVTARALDPSNNTLASCSFTVNVSSSLAATTAAPNRQIYFGYAVDQTSVLTTAPTGGTSPYKIIYTMNRALVCNSLTADGDETWTAGAGTLSLTGNTCPGIAPYPTPVATSNPVTSYAVTVKLVADAIINASVTDAIGCVVADTTQLYSEDVRCFAGNSGRTKVKLCHKNDGKGCGEICVDESAVAEHLAHGDFLGKCTPNCIPPTTTRSNYVSANVLADSDKPFAVMVTPNPSTGSFGLLVESNSQAPVQVRIRDEFGRTVKTIAIAYRNSMIRVGEGLRGGNYFAEITQGKNRKVVKLIKLN